MEKFNSFEKNSPNASNHITRDSGSGSGSFGKDNTFEEHQSGESIESLDWVRISEEVDEFINVLSAIDHDNTLSLPEVPEVIKSFTRFIESRILKYNAAEINEKFGKVEEEDKFFIESVRRLFRLTTLLSEFLSDTETNMITSSLNQTSVALQRAMVFLEEEFRVLLEDARNSDPEHENHVPNVRKMGSFTSKNHPQEHSDHRGGVKQEAERSGGESDESYPGYSPETVNRMHEIATTMIMAGYETECCQVYYISRRNAIRNRMVKLDFEIVLNMDDVVRLPWEALEIEISKWINVVKTCSQVIFPAEKKLGESVFDGYSSVHRSTLSGIVRMVVIQLLDFAEATAMAKRSAEKLFKYLDMYEALQQLIPAIGGESCFEELMAEVAAAVDRIGELASTIFCDLENSIQSDVARAPVPGGAVHPLTRYVMNYLKYTCEYKDTLEKIFAAQSRLENKYAGVSNNLSPQDLERESESPHNFQTVANATPFSIQVVAVMDLLDANLDKKSRLYRDASLRYVFLMNNGRYILQKVKGSTEIRQVMGDTWCRRRSTIVRQYHTNYQRETWSRVLQSLSHDGLLTNGNKVNKPLLKERLKIFTTIFEEIHRTQSTWIVSDEQLQSELRISISGVVIPAYRSFVGRFRQYLDSGKQADKYIKYQPEDIETLIEGLFDGNTSSMTKRKT